MSESGPDKQPILPGLEENGMDGESAGQAPVETPLNPTLNPDGTTKGWKPGSGSGGPRQRHQQTIIVPDSLRKRKPKRERPDTGV